MTRTPPTEIERQIATLRAQCTPEEQDTFAAFYAAALADALQEAHAAATPLAAIDPDAVEQERLAVLAERARGVGGTDDTASLCYVPLPHGRLYRFTPPTHHPDAAPASSTGDSSPATTLPSATSRRWALAVVVGAALLLLFVLWPDAEAAPSQPASAAEDSARSAPPVAITVPLTTTAVQDVRNRDANTDDPTTLEISGTQRLVWRVVPSRSELGGVWRPQVATGTAAWLADSVVNPIVCVPPDDAPRIANLARGTALWLRLASGTVRPYEILAVERVGRQQTEVLTQREARLTIIVCGVDGNERIVATALYRPQLDGLPPLPDAKRATIPQWMSVAHQRTELVRDGDDLRITLSMQLTNESGRPLPLTDLLDHLLLDGEAMPALLQPRAAPLAAGETRTVPFVYLVPAAAQDAQAIWHMVTPDGQRADLLLTLSSFEEK